MKIIISIVGTVLTLLCVIWLLGFFIGIGWWSLLFAAAFVLACYIKLVQQERTGNKEAEKRLHEELSIFYDLVKNSKKAEDLEYFEKRFREAAASYRMFCRDIEKETKNKRKREEIKERNKKWWNEHPEYAALEQKIIEKRKKRKQEQEEFKKWTAENYPWLNSKRQRKENDL